MSHLLRWGAGALLFLLCTVCSALIQPTQSTLYGYATEPPQSTPLAACQYHWDKYTNDPGYSNAISGYVDGITCVEEFRSKADGSLVANGRYTLSPSVVSSCPANSTAVSGGCACSAGFGESGNSCVAAGPAPGQCKVGETLGSGYYDVGTSLAGSPAVVICSNGCQGTFDGTFPAGSSLVGNVKHYYAQGSYIGTGSTCNSGTDSSGTAAPTPTPSTPADTCAEGQIAGTVNGKQVCVKMPDASSPADPSNPAKPQVVDPTSTDSKTTSTESGTTTNADGSKTTTSTTTSTGTDGKKTTTTTTTTTNADGTPRSSTTKTTGTGVTDEAGKTECEKNSSASGCGGTATNVSASELYTVKDKTISSILTDANTKLSSSPVGSGITGFFSVSSGGSCPASVWNLAYFNRSYTFDGYCSQSAAYMFAVIKGVLLLVASFMAFRAAME